MFCWIDFSHQSAKGVRYQGVLIGEGLSMKFGDHTSNEDYQKVWFLISRFQIFIIPGGNLYKETIEFLKDEIEEIEQVRNMLKAEDDRLGGKSGKSQ